MGKRLRRVALFIPDGVSLCMRDRDKVPIQRLREEALDNGFIYDKTRPLKLAVVDVRPCVKYLKDGSIRRQKVNLAKLSTKLVRLVCKAIGAPQVAVSELRLASEHGVGASTGTLVEIINE